MALEKKMAASLNVVDQNKKKIAKRKYPKCVPAAKAAAMSKSQIKSAVSRKRAVAQGVGGPKPTNVKTIVKKKTRRKNKA